MTAKEYLKSLTEVEQETILEILSIEKKHERLKLSSMGKKTETALKNLVDRKYEEGRDDF